jgi:hypothetical protein
MPADALIPPSAIIAATSPSLLSSSTASSSASSSSSTTTTVTSVTSVASVTSLPSNQSTSLSTAATNHLIKEGSTINPKPLDIHWGTLPEVCTLSYRYRYQ